MKKENMVVIVCSILFLLSLVLMLNSISKILEPKISGYATTSTTVSNVTISKFLSIDMSTNLTEGILFGNISALPAVNANATHNYDSVQGNSSSMIINVSTDSNTNVDFCVKANANLIDSSGGNTLGIGNESYHNATLTNTTLPTLGAEVKFTTSYVKAGENVNEGDGIFYRFWLDIPAGQAAGTYNNTIDFKGIETATSC